MKRLTVGILAHVDSGKTTLSEAMLFRSGGILKLGRVDHKNAFLDTDTIERDRGITIFSKQAVIDYKDVHISLLDTPGHVDFSAEMERVLSVIDYAVLVISGTDGVQSHTETLWKLLEHYGVPAFIFVNKMDLPGCDKGKILSELTERLSGAVTDFSEYNDSFMESIAMQSQELLDEYMETSKVSDEAITKAILSRNVYPCIFGSALKLSGVDEFLEVINRFTVSKKAPSDFGARIFKISEDDKGQRLAYMKITGGSLAVKTSLSGNGWTDKVNEIRIYSGAKYKGVQEVFPGEVCAVCGLSSASAGEGLGIEKNSSGLLTEPVFTYSVKLPDGVDSRKALSVFRKIEQEETQLHILWNEYLQKIDVQVMGEVQLEVLKRILSDRFGLEAEFEHGSIIYKETIRDTVEGVGHYEPLRHYAEVHLLMEPLPRGSGIVLKTDVPESVLDRNWQRLILTHLAEKTHYGVLTGSPITDIKITIVAGRAHLKHTEGGDFRQATYRAVRQGLMQAESVLLEPFFEFVLEVPTECVGRALTDLKMLGAELSAPETAGDYSVVKGVAPVVNLREYPKEIVSYTRGKGRLSCSFSGFYECHNADEVIEKIGYNCNGDTENPSSSVFCSHGSGFVVPWDEVFDYMHIEPVKMYSMEEEPEIRVLEHGKITASDEELQKIFERTYGKIQRDVPRPMRNEKPPEKYKSKNVSKGPVYLLIDGYNIIFAWDDLKKLAQESLELARVALIDRICNYQAVLKNNVIIVFDAYKVKGNNREVEREQGISVVYTKEAETADEYIEKTAKELRRNYRVRVATSDSLEQIIIFGHGAQRISASEFLREVESAEGELRRLIYENNNTLPLAQLEDLK